MKKRLIVYFCFALTFVLAGCSDQKELSIATFNLTKDQIGNIIVDDSFTIHQQRVTEEKILSLATDKHYLYEIRGEDGTVAELSIVVRTLQNQDAFLFTRLTNQTDDQRVEAKIELAFKGTNRYTLNDFDSTFVEHEHDGTLGVDPTTYPIGLIDFYQYETKKFSVIAGRNYTSKQRTKTYPNEQKSIIRELMSETKNLSLSYQNGFITSTFQLSAEGDEISEQWMLSSKESLFKDETNLMEWISYQQENYKHVNKWYTEDGPFKKLPWSIEPFTEMGYGRNLGNVMDQKALDFYKESHERYFYDFVLNAVVDLHHYRQAKGTDLWETEYTSTWLKKAYGTKAPYIDTRHNEKIALFLYEVGTMMNVPELTYSLLLYGDYLVEQVEVGNTFHVGSGYLIADYYTPYDETDQMTHSSVNHVLGGFNILLDCYLMTGDEKYLTVAMSIHKAFEEIAEDLIRPNGDLWYQVNPDLTFAGTDYEQLTLIDLLDAQDRLIKAGFPRSHIFDLYIHSKYTYLKKEEKTIYDDVINRLKQYGF